MGSPPSSTGGCTTSVVVVAVVEPSLMATRAGTQGSA